MTDQRSNSTGTLILLIIAVPIIAYLLYFAHKKSTESEAKSIQCRTDCTAKDYRGYEFKWNILSGPKCNCFDE